MSAAIGFTISPRPSASSSSSSGSKPGTILIGGGGDVCSMNLFSSSRPHPSPSCWSMEVKLPPFSHGRRTRSKCARMCSKLFPRVSGTQVSMNNALPTVRQKYSRHTPASESTLRRDRNVAAPMAASERLPNVAMLIAFARTSKLNTSEGKSHAPGPIPRLKNDTYSKSASTERPADTEASSPSSSPPPPLLCARKLAASRSSATAMPKLDAMSSGRLPTLGLSKSLPASTITATLQTPTASK
mmetsp:Transcript_55772/g.96047  ORF Transcript_55772/g.96047 Transcript_55772/m.96047 type:complete len:243 (+) Transcript_55772:260-988(+)